MFVDAQYGPDLIRAVRSRPELAAVHVVACVDLDSPDELRDALDAGATTSCGSRSTPTS